jgi:O-antigen ligase
MNLFSSWFFSVARLQTTKWAMQQMLVILPYFFLRLLAGNASAFRRAFQIVLAVGALEAAYAIVCFYSNLLFGTKMGMEIGQYDASPGTFGTQYEANILGAYCGACSIMMLAMCLKQPCRKYLLGFAVTAAAMTISLSRAVLLATALAFVVLLVYGIWARLLTRRALTSIAATVLCVALFLMPVLLPIYTARFSSLDVSNIAADNTAQNRLLPIAISWNDVLLHPIVGNGTSSFQLMFDYSEIDPSVEAGWIANTEMRVLHDTGAVGLGVFLLFLLALAFRARKTLQRKPNAELTALVLAALVYCISFQATEGTLLAFTWVHLGLIGCALSIHKLNDQTGEQTAGEIAAV